MKRLAPLFILFTIFAHSALAQPTRGLVLEYMFEDAPGDWVMDYRGQGYHVMRENTVDYLAPEWTRGYRKDGMAFDGVGSLLNLGDHDALDMQKYTISAWVKYSNAQPDGEFEPGNAELLAPRNHEIIEKIGSYWLNIRLDTGKLRSGGRFGGLASGCPNPITGKSVRVDSSRRVPPNKWTHVATSYNGKYLKVYIDGKMRGRVRAPSGKCNSPYPAIVGAQYSPLPYDGYPNGTVKNHFHGTMDEFRIYNRALSNKQIKQLARRR